MFLERIPAGSYGVNCYIVADDRTSKAMVVDPGGDVSKIMNILEEQDLVLEYIMLTHAHGDHIGGVEELRDRTGAKIYLHEDDADMLENSQWNYSQGICGFKVEITADVLLKDGDKFPLGDLTMDIIHTPGHTKGGICIQIENVLFSGDTLFANSIGRADLYGGNPEILIESVKNRLFVLDEELTVLPGHGPATTIRIEKMTNPYVR